MHRDTRRCALVVLAGLPPVRGAGSAGHAGGGFFWCTAFPASAAYLTPDLRPLLACPGFRQRASQLRAPQPCHLPIIQFFTTLTVLHKPRLLPRPPAACPAHLYVVVPSKGPCARSPRVPLMGRPAAAARAACILW